MRSICFVSRFPSVGVIKAGNCRGVECAVLRPTRNRVASRHDDGWRRQSRCLHSGAHSEKMERTKIITGASTASLSAIRRNTELFTVEPRRQDTKRPDSMAKAVRTSTADPFASLKSIITPEQTVNTLKYSSMVYKA